jgi:hypothetical protein
LETKEIAERLDHRVVLGRDHLVVGLLRADAPAVLLADPLANHFNASNDGTVPQEIRELVREAVTRPQRKLLRSLLDETAGQRWVVPTANWLSLLGVELAQ